MKKERKSLQKGERVETPLRTRKTVRLYCTPVGIGETVRKSDEPKGKGDGRGKENRKETLADDAKKGKGAAPAAKTTAVKVQREKDVGGCRLLTTTYMIMN